LIILGIETSCDETSAAVVENGRLMRSNVVASQVQFHAPYGGVVPEIASRHHLEAISFVTRRALSEASTSERDLDAVAVTYGPGLAGALLVGLNFARGLSVALGAPGLGVNHLEGHLHSVWLLEDRPPPQLPMLALIVSGGHTELVLMRDHGNYELLGRTRDDAAGEAFDKVARLLGLPYPGGPVIERAAETAEEPVRFPRAWLRGTHDFSFSGVKTAVLHTAHTLATGRGPNEARGVSLPQMDVATNLSPGQIADLAAGFQESVVDVLVTKTAAAAEAHDAASVAVVGGVAANGALRARMEQTIRQPLYISPPHLSTDNAAMIAASAYFVPRPLADVDVSPGLRLAING
jgi:N6-L-threonylcarbamoyladenine synthase